jgi:hypothetical protein
MTQIHLVVRRINPALKIDFVQIGHVEGGQFASLPVDVFEGTPVYSFLKSSNISESLYLDHEDIPRLVSALCPLPGFGIDYFDNTLVLVFDLNIDSHEVTSKEEGKGN